MTIIPIQITLQAASASEASQLVRDLAGTLSGMAPEQIPARTEVSTVAPTLPAAPVSYATPATAPAVTVPPVVPTAAPVTYAPPAAIPTAPVTPPPAAPQQPAPGAVPTAAPETYTIDQLAVAATQLMDNGKQQELVNLLSHFGVQALTALPKEQFGEFATRLRMLGARI